MEQGKNWFICPECKGKGEVWDHMEGVFTLGLSYLLGDKDICPRCKGKGYIKVYD